MGRGEENQDTRSRQSASRTACEREGSAYIDGFDPVRSFTLRELPPFAPHFGVLARRIVGNGGGCDDAEEENTDETEEGAHNWRGQ